MVVGRVAIFAATAAFAIRTTVPGLSDSCLMRIVVGGEGAGSIALAGTGDGVCIVAACGGGDIFALARTGDGVRIVAACGGGDILGVFALCWTDTTLMAGTTNARKILVVECVRIR